MPGTFDPHGPLDRMGRWDDPELAGILADDPDLYELSRTLRASRPEPVVGPHFEPYLRARLMDAAASELRPRRGLWGLLRPRPGLFAGGGAALGVAMIAAVVVATVMYHPQDVTTFKVSANVQENHQVSPDDVIQVSFNQPVDHAAVERNLQIHPATAVQTSWHGTTLVITPLHHLVANTPYTVTIPRTAVRDSSGRVAAADVRITFGTAPTPSAGPSSSPAQPAQLQPQPLGPVSDGSALVVGPNGVVVSTSGLLPAPTPSPQATAGAGSPLGSTGSVLPGATAHPGRGLGLQSPTPAPTAQSSPSPSASPAPPATALLQLDGDGAPRQLGPAAGAAAFSPSGRSLAYLVADGDHADLLVALADGSHPVTLARSVDAGSPLAWAGEDSLVYLSGGQVTRADLEGRTRTVSGGLRVAPGQPVLLAPGGRDAFVGPVPGSGGASPSPSPSASPGATSTPSPDSLGRLVDLATGDLTPLQGIQQLPAFSGDGAAVAWVDDSGTTPLLDVMPTASGSSARTIATPAVAGDSLGNLALSGDGTRLAYTLQHGTATPALRVVSLAGGDVVAVGDGQPVQSPVLSQNGDRVAFLRQAADGSVTAELALIPGAVPVTPAADAMPPDAGTVLDQFVAAQARGDAATMRSLAAAGVTLDPALAATGVTRTYVITAALDSGGTVTALVRLVRDATASAQQTSFADETVKLARPADGQPFQVTAAAVADFQTEPAGPQVVHVSTERQQSALVVRIAFDSDLDPATAAASAVTLVGPGGATLPAQVQYEVESRTLVVRLASVPAGPLTLSVGNTLRDIAGQALQGGYSTTVQG